ncbi:MAG: HAMP domain-containing sensor histidine kinase [bacterium]|nr:HAMP domain-containing sensor histidine kinase [bacterium]
MFESTRIKLTLWYVLIITVVCVLFGIVIFSLLHRELMISENRLGPRMERLRYLNPDMFLQYQAQREATEQSIKLNLLYMNMLILGVSTIAGYFLAGKTLKPIQHMVEEQNRFIADASHELKTPITALRTGTEVTLRDKKLTLIEAKKILEGNLEEIKNLQSLSDNLLSLAKFDRNHSDIQTSEVSLKQTLIEAKKIVDPLASRKQIDIKISGSDTKVKGYKEELVKLFVIFLDNAIKYSSEHTVIQAVISSLGRMGVVKIVDHGIGINPEDISHIFDRFYRTDKSRRKDKTPGYGLGLSIAKKIVELHHSGIKVESTVGKGTTFVVSLPK